MDAAVWLGIAGIAGTLLAPILSERMRRRSVRDEQLSAQRLVVYADLLRISARFVDNTQARAEFPLEELAETAPEELDRVFSQVRVIASPRVHKHVRDLEGAVHAFNRLLADARLHHRRLREAADRGEGSGQDSKAVTQRISLGDAAEAVRDAYRRLEEAMRQEVHPR